MDSVIVTSKEIYSLDEGLSYDTPRSKRHYAPDSTVSADSSANGSSLKKKLLRHLPFHRSNFRQRSTTEIASNSKTTTVRKFAHRTLGGVRYKHRRSDDFIIWEALDERPRSSSSSKDTNETKEFEYTPTRLSRRKSFSDLVGTLRRNPGWRTFREAVTPTKESEFRHITPIFPRKVDEGDTSPTRQHITIVDRRLDDSFRRTQKHSGYRREPLSKPSIDNDASSTVSQEENSSTKDQTCVASASRIREYFDPIFYFLPWHSRSSMYEVLYEETGERLQDEETDYMDDFYPEFPSRSKVLRERYLEVIQESTMRRIQADIKIMVQKMTRNQYTSISSAEIEDSNSIYPRFENSEEDFLDSVKIGTDIMRGIKLDSRLKLIPSCDFDKLSWVDKILQESKRLRRTAQKPGLSIAWIDQILEESVKFRTPQETCESCLHFDEDGTDDTRLPSAPPPTRCSSPVDNRETQEEFKATTAQRLCSTSQNYIPRDKTSRADNYLPSLWAHSTRHFRSSTPPVPVLKFDHSIVSETSYTSGSSFDGPFDDELVGNVVSSQDENIMRQGSAEKKWCILSDLKPDRAAPLPTWVDLGKEWRRKSGQGPFNFENFPIDKCEIQYDSSDALDDSEEFDDTDRVIRGRDVSFKRFLDQTLEIEERFVDALISWPELKGSAASEDCVGNESRSAISSSQVVSTPEAHLTANFVSSTPGKATGRGDSSADAGYMAMPDIDHCTGFKFSEHGYHLRTDVDQDTTQDIETQETQKDTDNFVTSSHQPCSTQKNFPIYLPGEGTGSTIGKVGHLINIFQAHGIMQGPKLNLARTRSPLQRNPGQGIFIVGSSEDSSPDHLPVVQNDRPCSRLSNQDTDFSSIFGEELERFSLAPFEVADGKN